MNVPKIVFLSAALCISGQLIAQDEEHDEPDDFKPRLSRLERKAAGYEHNIKKLKEKGRELLDEEVVNYAKVQKLKTKIKKLSSKAENCRYREKKKRHLKVQERSAKRRMKKGLKRHKKLSSNRRSIL